MKHSMIFQFFVFASILKLFFSPAVCFYDRWTLLVGLFCGRPALRPWNEFWLFDWGGANSSARNRSPGISSPAVSGSGRPADCLQPLTFPGPILLLCLVDCCLPLLHLPLWPLLPSASHGSIASTAQQADPHWATVYSASEMTEWVGAIEACWWLGSTAPPFPLPSLWPPYNDLPYHQSSWFTFQCFLHRRLRKLMFLLLQPLTVFIWGASFIHFLEFEWCKVQCCKCWNVVEDNVSLLNPFLHHVINELDPSTFSDSWYSSEFIASYSFVHVITVPF